MTAPGTSAGAAGTVPHVKPDLDAMLCALVLVPTSFSRNRFFHLFEQPELRRVRRRATRLRGILRQLLGEAEITGELELTDGRRLLRYRLPSVGVSRTAALSKLESATLRFSMARAKRTAPEPADRALVEDALRRLGDQTGVLIAPQASTETNAP